MIGVLSLSLTWSTGLVLMSQNALGITIGAEDLVTDLWSFPVFFQ